MQFRKAEIRLRDRVNQRIEQGKLTQAELSRKSGVPQSFFSEWLRGTRSATGTSRLDVIQAALR